MLWTKVKIPVHLW